MSHTLDFKLLPPTTKYECCNCGWIGHHSESADKTPVIGDMYLLKCPKCGNSDEFFIMRDNISTE